MGNQQPKKISKVTKAQIDVGCLKARIHLELVRDRKNNEVIKGEKQLLTKIKSKNRNKVQQILIAQRVVNGLKYAQACNLLIGYASNLRGQAHLISQNMLNPHKIEQFLIMIYSLIFAADQMGLSSLAEFKGLMRALNDPVGIQKYVNPDLINALLPSPSAEQLNIYMMEFSERNQIPLQEINLAGHKFTKEWKNIPSVQPVQPQTPVNFNDLELKINDPYGYNKGSSNQPIHNPYKKIDPNQLFINPIGVPSTNNFGNNGNNPYGNIGNNPNIGNNNPVNKGPNFGSNPYDNYGPSYPANLGPNFYVPVDITPKNIQQPGRTSINKLQDIDYYPQIDAEGPMFNKGGPIDASFDQICQRLKKGL